VRGKTNESSSCEPQAGLSEANYLNVPEDFVDTIPRRLKKFEEAVADFTPVV
jgi:hypothetical protein